MPVCIHKAADTTFRTVMAADCSSATAACKVPDKCRQNNTPDRRAVKMASTSSALSGVSAVGAAVGARVVGGVVRVRAAAVGGGVCAAVGALAVGAGVVGAGVVGAGVVGAGVVAAGVGAGV